MQGNQAGQAVVSGNYLITRNAKAEELITVYDIAGEKIERLAAFSIPYLGELHSAVLFDLDAPGYICGVALFYRNTYYGITEDLRLEKLNGPNPEAVSAPDIRGLMSDCFSDFPIAHPIAYRDSCFYFSGIHGGHYALWCADVRTDDEPRMLMSFNYDMVERGIPYIGRAAMSPDGAYLAFGYNFRKEIRILDMQTEKAVKLVFGDEAFSSEIDRTNMSRNRLEVQKRYYGGDIYAGENIYIKNLNGRIFGPDEEVPETAIIEKISPEGRLLTRYILDHDGNFAVDEATCRIFLFTYGEQPQLLIYRME